jgi:hypothetical protein
MLPASEVMLSRLESGGLLGTSDQANFLKAFAGSIGGRECNGPGIAAAWDLLMLTKTKHYPEDTLLRLESAFDMIIDTIVPDPEVAASAKGCTIASRLSSMMREGPDPWQIRPI